MRNTSTANRSPKKAKRISAPGLTGWVYEPVTVHPAGSVPAAWRYWPGEVV